MADLEALLECWEMPALGSQWVEGRRWACRELPERAGGQERPERRWRQPQELGLLQEGDRLERVLQELAQQDGLPAERQLLEAERAAAVVPSLMGGVPAQ